MSIRVVRPTNEIYLNNGFFQVASRIVVLRLVGRLAPALVFSTPAILGAVDLVLGLAGPLLLTRYLYRRSVWLRRLAMGDWKQPAARV